MLNTQIRIIGGSLKGRRISTLPGRATRPTSGRVREAIFDILGSRVEGSRVLDLFSGSGALGLEALSRGGAEAVLVESSLPARRVIRENIERLGLSDRAELLARDYAAALKKLGREGRSFDLVLADPPYAALKDSLSPGRPGLEKILFLLESCDTVTRGGIFILEHFLKARELIPPRGWRKLTRRNYGRTALTFFSPA